MLSEVSSGSGIYSFFFLAALHAMWECGILVLRLGIEATSSAAMHGKCRVVTAGTPGEVPGIHSEDENLLPVEETYFGPMNFLSIRPWVFTRVCICGVALHPAPWDTPSAVNGF